MCANNHQYRGVTSDGAASGCPLVDHVRRNHLKKIFSVKLCVRLKTQVWICKISDTLDLVLDIWACLDHIAAGYSCTNNNVKLSCTNCNLVALILLRCNVGVHWFCSDLLIVRLEHSTLRLGSNECSQVAVCTRELHTRVSATMSCSDGIQTRLRVEH